MSNNERRIRCKRLMSLLFSVMLILSCFAPAIAVSKDGKTTKGTQTKSSLYDLVDGVEYKKAGSGGSGGSGGGGGGTYIPPTYNLYAIREFPLTGYYKIATLTKNIEKDLPTTVTLELDSTGSYTRSAPITWTLSTNTREKATFEGKVSLPSDVNNPKGISLDYTFTAILSNKKIINDYVVRLTGEAITIHLTDPTYHLSIDQTAAYSYTGKQICPKVIEVVGSDVMKKEGNKVSLGQYDQLKESDFDVYYGANTLVGKGTVTITAKENSDYVGRISREFDIKRVNYFRATYNSRKNYVIKQKDFEGDSPFTLQLDYPGSEVIATSPNEKITVSNTGLITVEKDLPAGIYPITLKPSNPDNFEDTNGAVFKIIVPTEGTWSASPESDDTSYVYVDTAGKSSINTKRETTIVYNPGRGEFYYKGFDGQVYNAGNKLIDSYYRYEDEDLGTYAHYHPIVGDYDDMDNSTFGVKRTGTANVNGNQFPYVFSCWCYDPECKNPVSSFGFTNPHDTLSERTLYAKWLIKQEITGKDKYTKYLGQPRFKLDAKAATKLKFSSSKKTVATVSDKGEITIKGPGTATITVKAASSDKYTAAKKTITINVTPKPTSISGISKGSRSGTVKIAWKTVSKVNGYQIRFSTNSDANNSHTKKISGSTTKHTEISVTKGKKYYYWIRTCNGSYYSKWSAKKTYKLS